MDSFDPSSEKIVDYRNYDFRAVWSGRRAVDQFDQALLELSLDHLDLRRTLEIGTGFGRLTPQILRRRGEYVGVDYNAGGLHDTRRSNARIGSSPPRCAWVAANAYHLPFASGSFSAVLMIRVHHHLADPLRALREISRVLVPGGTALVTYNDRTWLRAVIHDAGMVLRRTSISGDRHLLGAREGHLLVRKVPTPQYITTPSRFARDLRATDLRILRSYGGAETTAAHLLPLRLGILGGRLWPGAPLFSTRWVVMERPGAPHGLRPWKEILTCPRCGSPGPSLESSSPKAAPCPTCDFRFGFEDGFLDARFVPGAVPPSGIGPAEPSALSR